MDPIPLLSRGHKKIVVVMKSEMDAETETDEFGILPQSSLAGTKKIGDDVWIPFPSSHAGTKKMVR